jgi:poly-gamma-glutamate capsule biosynthesis protein CapA/YwtB (metallophosphatase superfamily)
MIGNLEGTFSVGGASKCGGGDSSTCFSFQAPPGYARTLDWAGFDAMNLANNHAYDFGPSGQRQTVAALRRHGIAYTGLPGRIAVVERRGVKVAIVGFAPYRWAPSLLDLPGARRLVKRAGRRADVVVVAFHGGAEGAGSLHVPRGTETYLGENRGNLRAFARTVIGAGADLVVGSGPHVPRGIELFAKRPVFYSTGNFVGYRNFGLGGATSLSAIVSVTTDGLGRPQRGRWSSVRLVGPGQPVPDAAKASGRLVARLSRQDFGPTALPPRRDGSLPFPAG